MCVPGGFTVVSRARLGDRCGYYILQLRLHVLLLALQGPPAPPPPATARGRRG
jgi:hypothetical protein